MAFGHFFNWDLHIKMILEATLVDELGEKKKDLEAEIETMKNIYQMLYTIWISSNLEILIKKYRFYKMASNTFLQLCRTW